MEKITLSEYGYDCLQIETASACNMACSFCPYPLKDDKTTKLPLQDIKNKGVNRLLVGFTLQERRIPRPKCSITVNGKNKIGTVTSGAFSPTLDTSIGLGYVHPRFSSEGSTFMIDIRGNLVEATVTSLPFYSRRKNK